MSLVCRSRSPFKIKPTFQRWRTLTCLSHPSPDQVRDHGRLRISNPTRAANGGGRPPLSPARQPAPGAASSPRKIGAGRACLAMGLPSDRGFRVGRTDPTIQQTCLSPSLARRACTRPHCQSPRARAPCKVPVLTAADPHPRARGSEVCRKTARRRFARHRARPHCAAEYSGRAHRCPRFKSSVSGQTRWPECRNSRPPPA